MLHRIHERTAYLYMEIVIGVYNLTSKQRPKWGFWLPLTYYEFI